MAKRSEGRWSFNAGRKGFNWVRAFQHHRDGSYYLEWMEEVRGPDGVPLRKRRARSRLAERDQSPRRAKAKANELAERFKELARTGEPDRAVTIAELLQHYVRERTPTKGRSKRGHDGKCLRLWMAFFAHQPEEHRGTERSPDTLDRVDWERFAADRREGRIAGWGPVRDRVVEYDLKFMIAVLNWGTGVKPADCKSPYLTHSPWSAEIRRSQRWPMPREKSPHRPAMTDRIRSLLIERAPGWQFAAALELERETRRRNSAIRRLRWSDVDLSAGTIRWRGRLDKSGQQSVTPLTERAIEILTGLPVRGIGEVPVFPSGTDPKRPTSRHTFQTWLRRAKAKVLRSIEDPGARATMLEQLRGVGFHAEKRSGVRDPRFRALSPKAQETMAGTTYETLRRVYDDMSVEELRGEMETLERRAIPVGT